MGHVLEFPSRRAQGLAYLDRELRALLASRGADEKLVDFAAQQLTRLYSRLAEKEDYSFSVQLPAGLSADESAAIERQINAGLEGIRRDNHALLLELIAQLVLAEVRLFQQQRG